MANSSNKLDTFAKGGLLTSSTKLPFQIDTYESQTYVDKFSAVNTCDVFKSFN